MLKEVGLDSVFCFRLRFLDSQEATGELGERVR